MSIPKNIITFGKNNNLSMIEIEKYWSHSREITTHRKNQKAPFFAYVTAVFKRMAKIKPNKSRGNKMLYHMCWCSRCGKDITIPMTEVPCIFECECGNYMEIGTAHKPKFKITLREL